MRPMKLTMSAFGPYAELTVIDMEALTAGGLYLITGDTGAGKTMIFDAIAYALYGEASGTGRKNDMLRSKYAEPGTETFVELEFLHRGERYLLRRVYGKERIKRNGERVEEKSTDASLLMPDGRVVTKHKEVTAAVEALIGFDSARFRGTAMLAQGEFREFLFADTQKRLEVLRKLFNTDIYLRFAEEVRGEYNALEREYQLKKQSAEQAIAMFHCAPTSEYREALDTVKQNGAYAAEALAVMEAVLAEDTAASAALETAGETAERTLLVVQGLLSKCETDRANEERLEKGKGMLLALEETIAALDGRVARMEEARERYEGEKETLGRLELQLPEYIRLEEAKKALSEARAALSAQCDKRNGLLDKRTLLETEIAAIGQRLTALQSADSTRLAEEYAAVGAQKEETDNLLMEIRSLAGKETALRGAREAYRRGAEASDSAAALCAAMERAYFDGIAGILAETLTEGAPCPVCGSAAHPSPARRNEGVPDREALERRRREAGRLAEEAKALSVRAGELNGAYTAEREGILRAGAELFPDAPAEPDGLRTRCEERSAALMASLNELLLELREAEKAEAERAILADKRERFIALLGVTAKKEEEATVDAARLEAEAGAWAIRLSDIAARLDFSGKEEAEETIRTLRGSLSAYEEAKASAEAERNKAYLTRAGYTAAIEELEEQLKDSTAGAYDALTAELQKQTEERRGIARALAEVHAGLERNRMAATAAAARLGELAALGTRLGELKSISDTANGVLSGKEKLTLEAFAQMRLFERIIRRASTRLMKLTDGQYELIRRREGGLRGKTGLDIDVVDHYNSSVRSVKSLSGGEAFKASLALALGLSDETEAECGGVVMDAMFIDEGFGSLDEESLGHAVAMLASLSGGGRSIGIISHVAELRERIDRQLVVKKTAGRGSVVM